MSKKLAQFTDAQKRALVAKAMRGNPDDLDRDANGHRPARTPLWHKLQEDER